MKILRIYYSPRASLLDDSTCVKNTVMGMMCSVLVCLSCPASTAHFIYMFFFSVDIISAIEFDRNGDHLATGDRGGRVVLFEKTDTRAVYLLSADCFLVYSSEAMLFHSLY